VARAALDGFRLPPDAPGCTASRLGDLARGRDLGRRVCRLGRPHRRPVRSALLPLDHRGARDESVRRRAARRRARDAHANALLGGANYALAGPYPQDPLREAVALLTFAAIATPVFAAVRMWRAEPTLRAYAFYWAAAVGLLCFVFVVTPNAAALGPKSVNYLLTLAPAAGVGIGLVAARAHRGQIVVALAVATVAATNIAGILDGRAEVTGVVALPRQAQQIT